MFLLFLFESFVLFYVDLCFFLFLSFFLFIHIIYFLFYFAFLLCTSEVVSSVPFCLKICFHSCCSLQNSLRIQWLWNKLVHIKKIKAYNEQWKVLLNKYSLFCFFNTYASLSLKHRCLENYRKYYDFSSSTHFHFIKFICWWSMKLDFILESTTYVVKHAELLTILCYLFKVLPVETGNTMFVNLSL